ncbi:ABC transporter substrate-binding protein [Corticibacterium sp. UT-5YL-CI-8]|nr:ABC transporter substrate-binding protein [Tianweitania sp. UT-5YL-CI-8]
MRKTLTALATIMTLTGTASAADLRMSWWGGDSRHVATQEALKVCGEKHGHTIKAEFTGWSGHQEKITTQLAGSTEADIMQINWPWLPLFSKNGDGFADLTQYADVIDLSQWSEELLATATMSDKLNGLPVSVTGRVFYLNQTPFEKVGIAVPTNWEELIASAPKLKEKLGANYYPFDAVKLNSILIVSLITTQMTGKDLIDPATNQVAWTPEELRKGLEFYQNLVETGTIRAWKDAVAVGNVELFDEPAWAEGRIGGSYEWDSTFSKYADPLKDGKLMPLKPFKVSGATTEGMYRKPSMMFSISKNSKEPKAAAQIINCLLNEPEGVKILGDSRGLPASAIALKTLSDEGKLSPSLLEANQIVMTSSGPTVSPYNEHPKVREIFEDAIEEYAYGQIDAEEAAGIIIDDINETLSNL